MESDILKIICTKLESLYMKTISHRAVFREIIWKNLLMFYHDVKNKNVMLFQL